MTISYTTSASSTFSLSNARYVGSKLATDLRQLQRYYGRPSDKQIADYAEEAAILAYHGYVQKVIYGFKRGAKGRNGLIFTNTAGGPVSRTAFRARVWRPSLVRAGLLGEVLPGAGERFEARWTDQDGLPQRAEFATYDHAVTHVARQATGALTFHGLRHSYATWLVDDGVPINMVQKVLGRERSSTRWTCTPVRPPTMTVSGRHSTTATRAMSRRHDGRCRGSLLTWG